MNIKPKETYYNGYRFRSRLEARWAVFFDSLGIKYEYEPEGFRIGNKFSYLPDFYLTELLAYIEIKHVNTFDMSFDFDKEEFCMSGNGIEKYATACKEFLNAGYMYFILCGDPIDVLCNKHGGNGIGVIFERMECIPKFLTKHKEELPEKYELEIEGCNPEDCKTCQHYSIEAIPFMGFTSNDEILVSNYPNDYMWTHYKQICPITRVYDSTFIVKNFDAAKKARQARFEHGEMPNVNI